MVPPLLHAVVPWLLLPKSTVGLPPCDELSLGGYTGELGNSQLLYLVVSSSYSYTGNKIEYKFFFLKVLNPYDPSSRRISNGPTIAHMNLIIQNHRAYIVADISRPSVRHILCFSSQFKVILVAKQNVVG